MSVALRPIVRDSTITDAKLAAGPAISKTNATPVPHAVHQLVKMSTQD